MSAIWGNISFLSSLSQNNEQTMEQSYGAPLHIDRIETRTHQNAYMACGIQYITKEAKDEVLPILDKDNHLLFTADCYLNNRVPLLEELSPEDFTIPDGTLMYLAYLKWGIQCLTHFVGSFSMAIYHFDTNTLYLAVDHTASRCLYYYKNSENIFFSTLLDPFLKLNLPIQKNENFIKDFLLAPKLRPTLTDTETPYSDIYKIPAATYLKINSNELHSYSYWNPSMKLNHTTTVSTHHKRYGSAFMKLYRDCIKDSIRSDGNIGIALSSGLDSSSLGSLAADLLKEEGENLYAYTYVPYYTVKTTSKHNILDESNAVKEIVNMHPNIIPHFINNHGNSAFSYIQEELKLLETPFKAFANMPCFLEIFENAKHDQCRVLLTGQCGNTSVSYGNIQHILYDLYISHRYISLFTYMNHYCKTIHTGRKKFALQQLRLFRQAKRTTINSQFNYQLDNPFLTQTVLKNYPLEDRFFKDKTEKYTHQYISHDMYPEFLFRKAICGYLGEINTKLGLRYGILYRDPTNDPRILHFCHQLPYQYFAYGGTPRWLILGNFKNILPDSILNQWLRYGVQSADWIERLQKNWINIAPIIEDTLNSSDLHVYFDANKIHSFFENNKETIHKKNASDLQYIFFLYIICIFCS